MTDRAPRTGGSRTAPTAFLFAVALAFFAALLITLAACETAPEEGPTLPPSATAGATVSDTRAATPTRNRAFPDGTTPATVVSVVDGDTIDVLIDGIEYRVRYIGVDTPETVDPRRPVECFGQEASEFNRQLVEGLTVGLEKDVSETDKFGRLLRYVWVNRDEMVNAALVRGGYAHSSAYPPDVRHQDLFDQLEVDARTNGKGLWGPICTTTDTPAATGTLPPGACEYSGTAEPVIKGNISSGGEKIYHVPGGSFYEQTVIDEAAGERWFCSEADAVAAGWRKSLR